jgi:[protein-PII] uridylyltransferase
MNSPSILPPIAEHYAAESASIRAQFEAAGDGPLVLRTRSDLVDSIVVRLYRELFSASLDGPKDFCVVALGGYGRRELFPHSDIDLLFLPSNGRRESSQRQAVATMARMLWDTRLRVSHTARTLGECSQLHRDNLEFNISLLDSRYLAGDRWLFDRLRSDAIPHFAARDRDDLVRNLADLIGERHSKHGNTVFHLEPNIKESLGGLRDYHVARWLTLIAEIETQGRMVIPEQAWPPALRDAGVEAWRFLAALRCFLHYRYERDDNLLSYESQEEAARQGIGHRHGHALPAADWMRTYFRHARTITQLAGRCLDKVAPARSSLYGLFQQWRSRLSSPDFSVVRERIFPRQPALAADERLLLDLFEMMARHGLALSREAERWVEEILEHLDPGKLTGLWPHLSRILTLSHTAEALRAMHRLGVLTALLPEFRAIDCLVVRDFFHRYTVDEHSLATIQNLQELRKLRGEGFETAGLDRWRQKLAEIFAALERPDLLLFTLLLHDIGKGLPAADHIVGSLEAADAACERLKLSPDEVETVRFLIASHLEMSATLQRRDIFDPETIKTFAERIGSAEHLKLLTLFTYADVKAVSPEALTPWKAEMLWRLYAATANFLARSLDEERVHVAGSKPPKADRVLSLLGASARPEDLEGFLEGFPLRYLETHAAEEIAVHYSMARQLAGDPVQVSLRPREKSFELTVLTADRPFLFASITGALAAWGMNILKADAFANRAGTVLDTFRFIDLHRTLELNPQEVARFKTSVADVLAGRTTLETMMKGRISDQPALRPKVHISTQVRFDDESSSHSTLMELITFDRPGLLYQVSSALAGLGCNIEVALIDTEGQKVIDVFYLTSQGAKLEPARQSAIRQALLERLSPPREPHAEVSLSS